MNSTQKKTLILSNSSLPHIEESESFKKAIKDNGFEAEIFIIDNGEHEFINDPIIKYFKEQLY